MSEDKPSDKKVDGTLVDGDGEVMQSLLDEMGDDGDEVTRGMESPFHDDEEEEEHTSEDEPAAPAEAPPRAPPVRSPVAAAPAPAAPSAPPPAPQPAQQEESGESTVMLDVSSGDMPPGLKLPPRARLRVVFGNDRGRTIELSPGHYTVGRHESSDVVLNDPAVSRKHFTIDVTDQAVRLTDLGSGNGTKLNGSRVQESDLSHGVQLEVGTTVLRFEDPTRPADAAPEPLAAATAAEVPVMPVPVSMGPPRWLIGVLSALLVLVLFVIGEAVFGWYSVLGIGPSMRETPVVPAPDPAELERIASRQRARGLLDQAQAAFSAKKWRDCADLADEALDLDSQLADARRLRDRALDEDRWRKYVETGEALAESNIPGDLIAKLREIPPSSTYYARAQKLISKPQGPPEDEIVAACRHAIGRRDVEGAEVQHELLLKHFPKSASADPLAKEIAALKRPRPRPRVAVEPRPERIVRPKPAPKPKPKRGAPRSLDEGYRLYREGSFGLASDVFKSIARDPGAPDSTRATAERKASAVARFQSSFKEGEAAVTSFQGARAVQSLEDALRADRQLGGGQSRRVYPLLSTAYTFKAKQSVTNKSYSRAMKFVRKSLAMDPTNQEAKGLRRILQDKASVLLNEAIAARNSGDTAKAERLLQTVLGIAEEGSSLYMKAWKALESR